jgi:hypothetical protein
MAPPGIVLAPYFAETSALSDVILTNCEEPERVSFDGTL